MFGDGLFGQYEDSQMASIAVTGQDESSKVGTNDTSRGYAADAAIYATPATASVK